MFNVSIVFKGRFQERVYYKRFLTYQKAIDYVYFRQKRYLNYIVGHIFDEKNQLEVTVYKNGLMSCSSNYF